MMATQHQRRGTHCLKTYTSAFHASSASFCEMLFEIKRDINSEDDVSISPFPACMFDLYQLLLSTRGLFVSLCDSIPALRSDLRPVHVPRSLNWLSSVLMKQHHGRNAIYLCGLTPRRDGAGMKTWRCKGVKEVCLPWARLCVYSMFAFVHHLTIVADKYCYYMNAHRPSCRLDRMWPTRHERQHGYTTALHTTPRCSWSINKNYYTVCNDLFKSRSDSAMTDMTHFSNLCQPLFDFRLWRS